MMAAGIFAAGFCSGAMVSATGLLFFFHRKSDRCHKRIRQMAGLPPEKDGSPKKQTLFYDKAVHELVNGLKRNCESNGSAIADFRNQLSDYCETCQCSLTAVAEHVGSSGSQADGASMLILEAMQQVMSITEMCRDLSVKFTDGMKTVQKINSSISEVASTCIKEEKLTGGAREKVEHSRKALERLVLSVKEIGKITVLIRGIAERTNLLALNAKIEAASAGEAGKGFTIVADEVKELAQESAGAILKINERIVAIQNDMETGVQSIGEVFAHIEEIDGISRSIAGTMDAQQAMANEFTRSLSMSNDLASSIFTSISGSVKSLENVTENVALVSCSSNSALQETETVRQITGNLFALVKYADSV